MVIRPAGFLQYAAAAGRSEGIKHHLVSLFDVQTISSRVDENVGLRGDELSQLSGQRRIPRLLEAKVG